MSKPTQFIEEPPQYIPQTLIGLATYLWHGYYELWMGV